MPDSARTFRRPWLEPVVFTALALVYLWAIATLYIVPLSAAFLVVVVAIPVASNIVHRDGPRALGFRLDNFLRAAGPVGLATAIGMVLVIGLGLAAGKEIRLSGKFWYHMATYPLWGLVQQWALQGFVYRRLRESMPAGRAALAAALLFAALHVPNPALVPFTLIGGYVWCRLYERRPNLFALALSHGWLASVVGMAIPKSWVYGLRVGALFFHFH